jgi:hypothetical protein
MAPLRQGLQEVLAWESGRLDPSSQSSQAQPGGDRSAMAVDPQALWTAIRRHRLEIVLAPWHDRLGWPQPLPQELVERARHQRLAALPLLAGAIEVLEALAVARVRALLIKGPALALQTTGDATARGRGDLDVLVDPCQLQLAIVTLEGLGFRRLPGMAPLDLSSSWGRYARWVGYELSLQRGPLLLDLHWDLGPLRSSLPAAPLAPLLHYHCAIRYEDAPRDPAQEQSFASLLTAFAQSFAPAVSPPQASSS